MKQIIYKYKLDLYPIQSLEIQKGFQILTLNVVDGDPYIWVLINDVNSEKEIIKFKTVTTGQKTDIDKEYKYLGSYFLNSGNFIAHVFILTQ